MPAENSNRPSSSNPVYDPYDSSLVDDPYPIYRHLRDEHPVYYQSKLDFWVLSRFEDIWAACRDPGRFSSAQGLTFEKDEIEKLGLAPTFIMMDPPQHTVLRKLISQGFTPRRTALLEDDIRRFVVQRVDLLVERIRADGEADFIETFASPIPTYVLANILGVPEEDRGQFDPWSRGIATAANDGAFKLNDAIDAVQGLFAYFGGMVDERRKKPEDDLISALIAAEVEGERLSNWDILGFCFVMIAGGNDTTGHLIGHGTAMLSEDPDAKRTLTVEPEALPGAIEEFLRLESSVQGLSRTTTEDLVVGGREIPKGKKVHMLFGAANRDEREFGPTASDLDIRRKIRRHLAFNTGPHFCIGSHVARLQARIAFEELLRRVPDFVVDLSRAKRVRSAFTRGYDVLPISMG